MKKLLALMLVLVLLLTSCDFVGDFIQNLTTTTAAEATTTVPNDNQTNDNTPGETGHRYQATATAPTCEEQGYTTYVCVLCGDTYVSHYISAYGHTWQDATAETPKTCKTCGATEGDKITGNETLYVHYVDVGQGDCIFIQLGDFDILIDAGVAGQGYKVSQYLKAQGVDDIELMINTHPDSDHCGGLTRVLEDHVVEEVWISKNTNKNTAAYKDFIAAVGKEGLTAVKPDAGLVYTYEYITLTVLYSTSVSSANDSSIVVMLEYGSFRFLFTGDIGQSVENQLVQAKVDLKCDVLKVGHHGSRTSSTAAFLSAVGAEYGIICVGTGNSYGHPTSDALNRLEAADVEVYRTDLEGDIVFSTNGTELYLPNGEIDTTGSVEK